MRRVLAAAGGIGVSFLVTACDLLLERQYFREGIGTDLYTSRLPEESRLQDAYVAYICQQAGMATAGPGGEATCVSGLPSSAWTLFVRAGMNDIDQRCDAYLAWLDNKRLSRAPILKQISDTQLATNAIMGATNVGEGAMLVVAAAFGLATSTFTNIDSRLLLELDKSTVQAVVLGRRNKYRADISKVLIDNRPQAIYALRSYLNICTPFVIETDVNTTVTVYQQGGAEALDSMPLIDADTVAAMTITDVNKPLSRPVTAPLNTTDKLLIGPDEKRQQPKQIKPLRIFACMPEVGTLGEVRKKLISYLETTKDKDGQPLKDPTFKDRLTNSDFINLRIEIRAGHKAC
jgi:hypothetical protein